MVYQVAVFLMFWTVGVLLLSSKHKDSFSYWISPCFILGRICTFTAFLNLHLFPAIIDRFPVSEFFTDSMRYVSICCSLYTLTFSLIASSCPLFISPHSSQLKSRPC
jgi:hypothetical protein